MGSIRRSPRNPSRWEARYRDRAGRQRTKTFDARADAKAWLAATETDLRRGSWIDPRLAAVRFEVVAERWLTSSDRKRPLTVARDRSVVTNHLLPVLGGVAVGSVTRADIQQIVNTWAANGTPSTVVRQYACMRAIFTFAETYELIPRSPCRAIRLPQTHPREAQILDGPAIDRLAAALGDDAPMVYLAVLGLRWGEIAGLRVGQLDLVRRTLTVKTQRTRGEGGRMVEQSPKTRAGQRTMTMPTWIAAMLAEHLARRGLTGADKDAPVFASRDGEPLDYSNWRVRVWLPARKAAGLSQLTFHDLKHTAATLLVEEGVDIKTAQTRLGHADPSTTLRIYAQATAQADREAAERVGERLRPGRSAIEDPTG